MAPHPRNRHPRCSPFPIRLPVGLRVARCRVVHGLPGDARRDDRRNLLMTHPLLLTGVHLPGGPDFRLRAGHDPLRLSAGYDLLHPLGFGCLRRGRGPHRYDRRVRLPRGRGFRRFAANGSPVDPKMTGHRRAGRLGGRRPRGRPCPVRRWIRRDVGCRPDHARMTGYGLPCPAPRVLPDRRHPLPTRTVR